MTFKEYFFSSSERSFVAGSDSESFFPQEAMKECHEELLHYLLGNKGIAILCGASGTGKTLLLHVLKRQLTERACERHSSCITMMGSDLATPLDFLRQIARVQDIPYQTEDKISLRHAIREHLAQADFDRLVLLVDEAQSAGFETLEEIRILLESCDSSFPERSVPLRVLLAGTPLFEERLTEPRFDLFNQRIFCRCYLEPFNRSECGNYIDWHLRMIQTSLHEKTGKEQAFVQFTEEAKKAIHHFSEGVPRGIDQLCDMAIRLATDEEMETIDEPLLQEAWKKWQSFHRHADAVEPELSESDRSVKDEHPDADALEANGEASCVDLDFQDCEADELASFDLDCSGIPDISPARSVEKEPEIPDNGAQAASDAAELPQTATKKTVMQTTSESTKPANCPDDAFPERSRPGYVYQSLLPHHPYQPVVIQYPCYVHKNIAMMNWIAPGHRIPCGTATPYREIMEERNERETAPPSGERYPDKADREQEYGVHDTRRPDNPEKEREKSVNDGSQKPTVLSEAFEEESVLSRKPVSLIELFDLKNTASRKNALKIAPGPVMSKTTSNRKRPLEETAESDRKNGLETMEPPVVEMVRRIGTAAERIEQAAERLETIGNGFSTGAEVMEAGFQTIARIQELPTCHELFGELDSLHQSIIREVREIVHRHPIRQQQLAQDGIPCEKNKPAAFGQSEAKSSKAKESHRANSNDGAISFAQAVNSASHEMTLPDPVPTGNGILRFDQAPAGDRPASVPLRRASLVRTKHTVPRQSMQADRAQHTDNAAGIRVSKAAPLKQERTEQAADQPENEKSRGLLEWKTASAQKKSVEFRPRGHR